MMYKADVAVCSDIRTKHSTQSERRVEFLNVKPEGGAWGSVVVKVVRCKSEGPGIDSKRWPWNLFWHFRVPWGRTQLLKVSTRIFLWVKAAGT